MKKLKINLIFLFIIICTSSSAQDKFTSNNPYNHSFNIESYNPAEYLIEIDIANSVVSKKIVKQ